MRSKMWHSGRNESASVGRAEIDDLQAGGHVRGDVVVREHGALGLAGRARGVDDGGEIARLDARRATRGTRAGSAPAARRRGAARPPRRRSLGLSGRRRRVHDDHGAETRQRARSRSASSRAARRSRRSPPCASEFSRMNWHRSRHQRGVDRHRHRAQPEDREIGDRPLVAGLGQQRHAIAAARRPDRAVRAPAARRPRAPARPRGTPSVPPDLRMNCVGLR